MTDQKARPSKLEESKALRYFGGKTCVISLSPKGTHWHHFKEDPGVWKFVDVIPILSNYNSPDLSQAKKEWGENAPPILPPDLMPEQLIRYSKIHFANWLAPHAYGCARLAYYIDFLYLKADAENRIPYACEALYYARHSVNYELIEDILRWDILKTVQETSLGANSSALIKTELAGLLSEHGKSGKANEIYNTINKKYIHRVANTNQLKYVALLRRQAMTIIAERGWSPRAKSMLNEVMDILPNDENLKASIANSTAWALLEAGNYSGALNIIEELTSRFYGNVFQADLSTKPINVTFGNVAEIFLNAAIASSHKDPLKGKKWMRPANTLFDKYKWKPFLLRVT